MGRRRKKRRRVCKETIASEKMCGPGPVVMWLTAPSSWREGGMKTGRVCAEEERK